MTYFCINAHSNLLDRFTLKTAENRNRSGILLISVNRDEG